MMDTLDDEVLAKPKEYTSSPISNQDKIVSRPKSGSAKKLKVDAANSPALAGLSNPALLGRKSNELTILQVDYELLVILNFELELLLIWNFVDL
jgi:hypothetical protein